MRTTLSTLAIVALSLTACADQKQPEVTPGFFREQRCDFGCARYAQHVANPEQRFA